MAVLNLGCGSDDKENAPLPPSAVRGIAVKRQTMKRPGGGGSNSKALRRRLPFRDITWLFVNAAPCPPPPSTAVLLALSDAAAPPEAVPVRPGAGGDSDGVTVIVKQGSRSLRMRFR